ncbi:hypothetical protein SAMN05216412_10528 [Nitrosospira multiformis]|uniref:Uncharacterized protein n=1 Tax=Nitrosospira multiformis TaxID=1231 RepID=A0A1I0DKS5_9PROT|nr:hypothetical protein SAMN05216412_10528 [Nitrosospira multiformis]
MNRTSQMDKFGGQYFGNCPLQSAPGALSTLNRSKETGTIKTFPIGCQFQFVNFGSAFEVSSAAPESGKRSMLLDGRVVVSPAITV